MNLKKIKNVAPNKNLFKKVMTLILSFIVIIISFIIITNSNKDARDTVNVIRVKQDGGLPADSLLSTDNLEKYAIIKKEYTNDMVLDEDKEMIFGMYTKYYIRNGGILYKDDFRADKPLKNEWLYELHTDNEVLTIPYNYLECGGDILTPGDRIKVRVSYEEEKVPASDNPNIQSYQSGEKTMKMEVLFDSIVVKDMLNQNSHSIYEVYKEVLKLSEDKRQEAMKSAEFMKSILPKALVLEGTSDQIDRYAKFNGQQGKQFLITILSRENSNIIIDQLPTIQNEVESWIEEQKKN